MGWVFNAEIRSASSELLGIGDCVNFELKIVVEVDGWAWHTDTKRFQRDRERQNDLVHAEWIVLRFTWLDLSERPHHVIESIHTRPQSRSCYVGGFWSLSDENPPANLDQLGKRRRRDRGGDHHLRTSRDAGSDCRVTIFWRCVIGQGEGYFGAGFQSG